MDEPIYELPRSYENTAAGASGMTLRDYFAGQALPAAMAKTYDTLLRANAEVDSVASIVAKFSYEVADAMLKERAKATALSEQDR